MDTTRQVWPGLFSLAIAATFAGSMGCGETTISDQQAQTYVAQWSPTVEDTLREMAVAPAGKKDFQQRLKAARQAQESNARQDDAPYDIFVDDVYRSLDYQFQFVAPGGLTERGELVWQTLQTVDEHALDPAPYPLDSIRTKLKKLSEANARFEKLASFTTDAAEKEEATKWLTAQPVDAFELDAKNYPQLTQTVLESSNGARMKERLSDYEKVSAGMARVEAEIEQLLARGLVQYAHEMKHFRIRDIFIHPKNFDRWNNPNIEGRRPDKAWGAWRAQSVWRKAGQITDKIAKVKETDILYERVRQTLRDALTADTSATLAALAPSQPQYEALKKEYLHYRDIVQNGGWPEVQTSNRLRKGQSNAVARALKERLQIEGYYPPNAPVDEKFDDELEAAITAYQKTHQMEVSGKPHRSFWGSLNISAERRMQQIALNMQRWRASNIDHTQDQYVYVNIPDFTAEVWTQQQRAMRFGIVVGNNDVIYDEEAKKKVYQNHTPVVSAYLDRIIYNPYWNVTARIRQDEILPQVRASVEASYKAKIERLVAKKSPASPQPASSEEPGQAAQPDSPGTQAQPASAQRPANTNQFDDPRSMVAIRFDGNSPPSAQPKAPAAPSGRTAESYWSMGTNADGKKQLKFDVAGLKKLLGDGANAASAGADPAESGADSALRAQFFYLDPATGMVDVSSTDKDHIPAWYEANDYEVMYPGNKKWEYVRMLPGPKNSLGKVKVIFPNMYDVYLHDTPAKALFRRDIRAFSHGCMRMEDPLGFAEYLLKQDGQWDDYNVPKILKDESYEVIFFRRQTPVHIDYMTVRVDDDGRANFLADIYNKDTFGEGDAG